MFRYYFKSVIYLFCRWIIHKNYLTAYVPKFDFYFKFKTEDVIGRLIYKTGIHEEDLTTFLLNNLHLDEEDIIFDIGANIGWYAILLEKTAPPSVRIFAFEPDPLNFSLLQHNVKINNASQVVCNREAISDTEETKILYQYPVKNQGRHSLLPINSGKQVEVQTISLDNYISKNKLDYTKVKFIKIDVEGYEYFALKGADQTLQHVPYILSEYSPSFMKRGGVSADLLLEIFYSHSYSPHLIEDGKLAQISREEILSTDHTVNLFWMKNGYTLSGLNG